MPEFREPRPCIQFSNEEEEFGWAALARLGILSTTRFVCFNTRDSAYAATEFPDHPESVDEQRYRNPPARNYVAAIKYLLDANYSVVHMGKHVTAPFEVEHPRFVQYASDAERTDFLDVFLYSKCEFAFQGNGSGIDSLATIFNKPLCTSDAVPLSLHLIEPSNTAPRMVVPALLRWDGGRERILTAGEMMTYQFTSTSDYARKGIRVEWNSPTEIRSSIREFTAMLELDRSGGGATSSPVQDAFWRAFLRAADGNGLSTLPKVPAIGRSLFVSDSFVRLHEEALAISPKPSPG
jgi:putative glycosyltransferase (TIGR04372 family)